MPRCLWAQGEPHLNSIALLVNCGVSIYMRGHIEGVEKGQKVKCFELLVLLSQIESKASVRPAYDEISMCIRVCFGRYGMGSTGINAPEGCVCMCVCVRAQWKVWGEVEGNRQSNPQESCRAIRVSRRLPVWVCLLQCGPKPYSPNDFGGSDRAVIIQYCFCWFSI